MYFGNVLWEDSSGRKRFCGFDAPGMLCGQHSLVIGVAILNKNHKTRCSWVRDTLTSTNHQLRRYRTHKVFYTDAITQQTVTLDGEKVGERDESDVRGQSYSALYLE